MQTVLLRVLSTVLLLGWKVQAAYQCEGTTGRHSDVQLTVWLLVVLRQAEIKPLQMLHQHVNYLLQIYRAGLGGPC